MATESDRHPLPFEPRKAPKAAKNNPQPAAKDKKTSKAKSSAQPPNPKKLQSNYQPQKAPVSPKTANKPPFTKEEMALPKVVSDRMAQRMIVFCGAPTVLGMATLIGGYVAITHGIKPPGVVVLLLSMGFLGLSVLGLTYGILSASWDEEVAGSKLGWQEFRVNWGRMLAAWKATRQKNV